MHPRQADPDEQHEQIDGLPEGVDVTLRLGGFDGGDVLVGDGPPVGVGLVEGDAFQVGPGDHSVVLGMDARQIVDIAREFGDGVGPQGDGAEELGAVGGHHFTKQCLFVPEVGVEAFLAGLGGPRDSVDPSTRKSVAGELRPGGSQDLTPKLDGVSHRKIIIRRTGSFGMVVLSGWGATRQET